VLFGLFVVKQACLIQPNLLIKPIQNEFLSENILVNQFLHKGLSVFVHFILVLSNEKQYDRLHEMVDADFALFLNQSNKQFFVCFPLLQDVPRRSE